MTQHRSNRTRQVAARVTAKEHDTISRRAADCGLSLSAFLRHAALGIVPRRRPGRIERQAVSQLSRLGNNLNQLARLANASGRLGSERRLDRVLDKVHRLIDELRSP